jgi:hypothetical protein
MKSQAIIVRIVGNRRSRLIMLDEKEGMIELLSYQPHRLHVGYQLEYQTVTKQSSLHLKEYTIVHLPHYLITTNIFFLHHIFELFYYFVPIGSCTQYLFLFLNELYGYNEKHGTMSNDHKRFFLIKFFYLIGIHEQGDQCLEDLLYSLASTPIDRFNNKTLDLPERKKIDFWLHLCIQSHPANKLFITRDILKHD